eukprot:5344298-Prymnesium_polylepis.1
MHAAGGAGRQGEGAARGGAKRGCQGGEGQRWGRAVAPQRAASRGRREVEVGAGLGLHGVVHVVSRPAHAGTQHLRSKRVYGAFARASGSSRHVAKLLTRAASNRKIAGSSPRRGEGGTVRHGAARCGTVRHGAA